MPTRPCPHCLESTPRHLPYSSNFSVADYYRCDTCGYVFTVEKGHPDGPIRVVTTNEPPYDRDSLKYWHARAKDRLDAPAVSVARKT